MSMTAAVAVRPRPQTARAWQLDASTGADHEPKATAPEPYASGASAQLVSLVAHELRAPLAALTTSSELLSDQWSTLPSEDIRRLMSVIHGSSAWLRSLVENLLCEAAIRDGRFSVVRRPIRLADVVADVLPIAQPLLDRKQQRLHLVNPALLPSVLADRRRIGQVLVNLLSNASKYSGRGLAISLILRSRHDRVRVVVSDVGPGLPEGQCEQLFSPFFRAGAAVAGGHEGVGLGLSIVKSIVEAHHGRVGAENRSRGGARFWFELPALPASAPLPGETDDAPRKASRG